MRGFLEPDVKKKTKKNQKLWLSISQKRHFFQKWYGKAAYYDVPDNIEP